MRVRRFVVRAMTGVVIVATAASSAFAQQDAEGSTDHPMLSRFPGYYIEDYEAQDFGGFEFDLADDKVQKVEGRYWQISYWLKEGAKKSGPVQGLGDTRPVADNSTDAGRSLNRRVELVRR
jgi:hypothetical protein